MLFISQDETGCNRYMVTNDQGLCLIYTSDGAMATFVDKHSRGLDPELRLVVGGDPGTRGALAPLFHHIRQYYK
jgi:hypothetical protein